MMKTVWMNKTPYDHMQMAVDIVHTSPHPTNKVAATLVGQDVVEQLYAISRTNMYPAPIVQYLGAGTRIGSASGSVHAEMACIIDAPKTKYASVFVTDPPCPNCMKYMAEAGIKTLYIDHKGFAKDFAKRRGESFENMSLRICKRAGIAVYEIFRKEKRLEPIIDVPKTYHPPIEHPALMQHVKNVASADTFQKYIDMYEDTFGKHPFALCFARSIDERVFLLVANIHAVIGYTQDSLESELSQDKYSYLLQPLNRLIVNAKRKGLEILAPYIYSSRTPTSRELVNFIGAGYTTLHIGDTKKARDTNALKALKQLNIANVLNVQQ